MRSTQTKFWSVIVIASIFLLSNCDRLTKKICGEPVGRQKTFIDSLNHAHIGELEVEQVPCYPGYIQVYLSTDTPRSTLEEINRAVRKEKYIEFLVYDKNRDLIMGNVGSM